MLVAGKQPSFLLKPDFVLGLRMSPNTEFGFLWLPSCQKASIMDFADVVAARPGVGITVRLHALHLKPT